jgi:hypothetical protein
LFDPAPEAADWRSGRVAEQRLSGLAGDPSVTAAQRREAADVLARFRSVTGNRPPIPPPSERILGLLMLVP